MTSHSKSFLACYQTYPDYYPGYPRIQQTKASWLFHSDPDRTIEKQHSHPQSIWAKEADSAAMMDGACGTVLGVGQALLVVVAAVRQKHGNELAHTEAAAAAVPTVPNSFSYDQTQLDKPLEMLSRMLKDSLPDCDRACPNFPNGGWVAAGNHTGVVAEGEARPSIPSSRIEPKRACAPEDTRLQEVAAVENCCGFPCVIPGGMVGKAAAGQDAGCSSPGFPCARNSSRT
jgi:hypothetical protein